VIRVSHSLPGAAGRLLRTRVFRAAAALALLLPIAATTAAATVQAAQLASQPVRERPDWRAAFDSAGVEGTFVLRRLDGDRDTVVDVHDAERARRPYLPASTFKIPNSLIALELGVVRDERQRFPYTWPKTDMALWNRDHTFATALKYSVVPVYQQIARQVGEARYREWLARLDYGNRDPGGGVDHFWLDGDLRISAVEQVAFLSRLAELRLPISELSQRIVHAMLVVEANSCYVLRAKTGRLGVSATRRVEPVGWYVGWVDTDTSTHVFAVNIDVKRPGDAAARQRVAKAVLARAGVIPTGGCQQR
jgi:beta-lactamase class D